MFRILDTPLSMIRNKSNIFEIQVTQLRFSKNQFYFNQAHDEIEQTH